MAKQCMSRYCSPWLLSRSAGSQHCVEELHAHSPVAEQNPFCLGLVERNENVAASL